MLREGAEFGGLTRGKSAAASNPADNSNHSTGYGVVHGGTCTHTRKYRARAVRDFQSQDLA
ncbi:hypothetical protein EON66_08965 [archaeon]|nr:MAG: hypothetical protein EON66_08965 [archaeon]